jgi:hypothetical protein
VTSLDAIVAALVPPAAGLPGAAEAGVAAQLPATLAACPFLAAAAAPAFAAVEAGVVDPSALEALRPAAFAALVELVVVTWATSDAVRAALGHVPDAPLELFGTAPLEPVLERGPRWRGAPT